MAPRIGRLRRRSEFLRVAASGRKAPVKGLILQARATGNGRLNVDGDADLWLGITVSRKVGKAVDRNRARRRLRAAARSVLPALAAPGTDYVLIGRRATLTRPFPALLSDLEAALRKLGTTRDAAAPTSGAADPGKPA